MAANQEVSGLIEQLGDFRTRAAARRQLLQLEPCPVEALLAVLGDQAAGVNRRWAAITILAAREVREALPPLVRAMREDSNLAGDAGRALRAITGLDLGLVVEDWESELGLAPPAASEGAPAVEPPSRAGRQPLLSAVRAALDGRLLETIEWDEDGYVRAELRLGDRRQQVLVAPGDAAGLATDGVLIYTECGVLPTPATSRLHDTLPAPPLGELEITAGEDGQSTVAIRCTIAGPALATPAFGEALVAVATYADSLEHTLTGGDRV